MVDTENWLPHSVLCYSQLNTSVRAHTYTHIHAYKHKITQKTIGNTFIKVPCSCHCLNLAINDFMDSLENANKCIETFSIVFSSRPVTSRLKLSCPKRCLTRWSNIFEICSFIVINNEAIEKFLSNKNNIKLSSFHKSTEIILNCINAAKYWAPMLTILLLPFKILSEKIMIVPFPTQGLDC